MKLFVAATVAAVSMASCAAVPSVGSVISLTGEIHVKGNDPFPTVVLQTSDQVVWELSGYPVAEARQHAGQPIRVTGIVLRAPGADTWLPAIKVDADASR
ncbi:hypothetical protein [Cupriavidus sp. TMH.W2]|uniref:hypothetical protein n=1 Tax=Cupriavidus sp. TMH.W2 TaxID=3434465 RepID=UPI003D778F63